MCVEVLAGDIGDPTHRARVWDATVCERLEVACVQVCVVGPRSASVPPLEAGLHPIINDVHVGFNPCFTLDSRSLKCFDPTCSF